MLDLPKPRLAVSGVMNDQVLAGILAANVAGIPGIAWPGPDFDCQSIRIREVVDHWLSHGLKFLSQNALWMVSPSGSTITRNSALQFGHIAPETQPTIRLKFLAYRSTK